MDNPKFVQNWCISNRENIGKIHILIHNAGISMRDLFMNTEIELGEKLLNVDFLSVFAMTKELMPIMNTQGDGSVICGIGSLGATSGGWIRTYYLGAKAAMDGFFKSLHSETRVNNIHCMMVHPGFVKTNLSINALVGDGTRAFGKTDTSIQNGTKVRDWCNLIIQGINNKKTEVWIWDSARLKAMMYLRKLFPFIADRALHKKMKIQLKAIKNAT